MKPHEHQILPEDYGALVGDGFLRRIDDATDRSLAAHIMALSTPIQPGENFASTMTKLNMAQPTGPQDSNQSKVQPTTILDDAANCIFGDRNRDYGSPTSDFACSAAMMSAYLNRRFGINIKLEPRDIGPLMILVKVSRMAHAPKQDNACDIAGYAACTDWVIKETGGYAPAA